MRIMHARVPPALERLHACIHAMHAVRVVLLVVTGRGKHSPDGVGRLHKSFGEWLKGAGASEFNLAATAVKGAFVVELFPCGSAPQAPSQKECAEILRQNGRF
jgi:hypothetical protein